MGKYHEEKSCTTLYWLLFCLLFILVSTGCNRQDKPSPGSTPDTPQAAKVYAELYQLYRSLHDAFGTVGFQGELHGVMK